MTIIGWNVINIAILSRVLTCQRRADGLTWLRAIQAAFGAGMPIYVGWAMFVVLALPWLFR